MIKDSIDYFLKVKKDDIYLICPFFEAFEGMVAIRTPQPEEGSFANLKLMVSPDFREEFEKILSSLSRRLSFERILGKV